MGNMEILNNPASSQTEKQCFANATGSKEATPPIGKGVDPLVIAFLMLLEASNVTAQTAIIKSKEMSTNANAQELLNDQEAQLQLYSVPNLKTNQHTLRESHVHWTWHPIGHGGFHYTTYTTERWSTHPNQSLINNAEAQNQEVMAERQMISNQLNVLQQSAQIASTGINTLTDESTQSMQEGSTILQILQSLTFQALLRQPPQN